MVPPSVVCGPVISRIMLVGQAPGVKEPYLQKPFAWTAGKTLFKWFNSIGLDETAFRKNIYMSAVCRCFPGKNPKGGDRVPSKDEILRCSQWLNAEIELLKPELLIPVGKLAITQYMACDKLVDVIGKMHTLDISGKKMDLVPLPHPSGASTWHRMEPGKTLLQEALKKIKSHNTWISVCKKLKP
ncbi:MAG: uracil-DNA glycosylase [Thiothrix sp.]|nr:MAG: uracil-DNA glycosylase [Thiothrix sp.]